MMPEVIFVDGLSSKGTTLLVEAPFVSVPLYSKKMKLCDYCFKSSSDLKKCTICKYVHYCDVKCQKKSWQFHKVECPILQKLKRDIPQTIHILLRLLIKLNTDKSKSERSYYSNNLYRSFDSLMSHKENILKDVDRMEHFRVSFALIQSMNLKFSTDFSEMLELFGKICINTTCVLDNDMNVIGSAIYLAGSSINHSCDPNSVFIFEGNTLHVRTIKDINNLKWCKICISYVELLNTPEYIRNELQRMYYFVCECGRCKADIHSKYVNSAICGNEKCGEVRNFLLETENNFECSKCATKLNKCAYSKIVDETNSALISINSSKCTTEESYKMLKKCYEKQKGIFSSVNLFRVKTLDKLFNLNIDLNNWEDAITVGYELLPGFRAYYGQYHPVLTVMYCKLVKLLTLVNKMDESIVGTCLDSVSVTFGNDHRLYRDMVDNIGNS